MCTVCIYPNKRDYDPSLSRTDHPTPIPTLTGIVSLPPQIRTQIRTKAPEKAVAVVVARVQERQNANLGRATWSPPVLVHALV